MSRYPTETIQNTEDFIIINKTDIDQIKVKALQNERKRIRINMHHSMESGVHEMIIVHCLNNYVRPHKHSHKTESFHIIEGELDVVLFDDSGKVTKIIEMGTIGSGKHFCYRTVEDKWHTVIPRTETVVFHETTNGPFTLDGSVQAPWAPADTNPAEGNDYLKNLGLLK